MSKGHRQRPPSIPQDQMAQKWELTFGTGKCSECGRYTGVSSKGVCRDCRERERPQEDAGGTRAAKVWPAWG